MRSTLKLVFAASVMSLVVACGALAAATPQHHPAYLRALSDLRDARAHLERPDHGELRGQERDAIAEIDRSIEEIKKASIDDGKNINDHVMVDPHMPWGGRLRQAAELLNKARNDVAKEEDDPAARGLKRRALEHIDAAHRHVQDAMAMAK